jgi:hypothetical protein
LANLVAVLNDAELPDEMKAALRPLVHSKVGIKTRLRSRRAARGCPAWDNLWDSAGTGLAVSNGNPRFVEPRRIPRSATKKLMR